MLELEMVVEVCEAVRKAGGPSLTPCLVAETGEGKTARVRELADMKKLPMFVILPATEEPTDLLGYPRPEEYEGIPVIRHLLREELLLAVEQPCLIFIDELDKAREETHAALLTLLASREVRGRKLHEESLVVCAMQPVDRGIFLATKTGEALSARLVFLDATGMGRNYLEKRYSISYDKIIESPSIELPILGEVRPRQAHWGTEAVFAAAKLGWNDEQIVELLCGVIPRGAAELLLERIYNSDWLDPWEIAHKQGRLLELVDKVPIGELQERVSWLLCTAWRPFCRALSRILIETDVETAASVLQREFGKATQQIDAAGGIIDPEPELSLEEGVKIFREEMEKVVEVWKKEEEARKGKLR